MVAWVTAGFVAPGVRVWLGRPVRRTPVAAVAAATGLAARSAARRTTSAMGARRYVKPDDRPLLCIVKFSSTVGVDREPSGPIRSAWLLLAERQLGSTP